MNLVLLGGLGQLAPERLLLLEDRLHLLHRDAVGQRVGAVLVHFLDAPTEIDVITLAELIQHRVGEDLLHDAVDLLLDLGGLRRNLGELLVRFRIVGRGQFRPLHRLPLLTVEGLGQSLVCSRIRNLILMCRS